MSLKQSSWGAGRKLEMLVALVLPTFFTCFTLGTSVTTPAERSARDSASPSLCQINEDRRALHTFYWIIIQVTAYIPWVIAASSTRLHTCTSILKPLAVLA